jgi:allophanate hydrolase
VWRPSRRILAEPILLNTRLGAYTNCVNLLGLCGVAVPAALRADGTPFGITILASEGADAIAASIATVRTRHRVGFRCPVHRRKLRSTALIVVVATFVAMLHAKYAGRGQIT